MALFKRADLKAQGLSDEQIDYIMTESGRSLSSNYVLSSDVQSKIDEAVKAVKPTEVDPKTTAEYMELAHERDMLRAIGGEDFASVKPKFREQVYGMLQTGEGAKPIAEQLSGIQTQYEEYFVPQNQPTKPTFGSPDAGTMPKGAEGAVAAFQKAWGYDK